MNAQEQTFVQPQLVRHTSGNDSIGARCCTVCKETKPITEFTRNKNKKTGFEARCKKCARQAIAEYRRNNPEKYTETKLRSYSKNKDKLNQRNREWGKSNRGYLMVQGAKRRAKASNLDFNLDQHKEEIQARVDKGYCEMTGIPFNLKGGRMWDTPSIDRINPERGYVYENIRIVCRAMNCMLGNWGANVMEKVFTAYMERK